MPATGVPSLDVIGFVRTGGLEPPRPKTIDPKSIAATITPLALLRCKVKDYFALFKHSLMNLPNFS